MKQLPDVLKGGERARLFPILADTSKEGRTLAIFLSCLENVPDLGRALLDSVGVRAGARASIETYTEVAPKIGISDLKHRPDGLIVANTGRSTWTALVEAKVGASDLTVEQIEAYLELAKLNKIDAVITLSNQFASIPTHHPLSVRANLTRKVSLFHWSWAYVITQAHLQFKGGDVTDREQLVLLHELQRFLLHPSSGVKEFDQMPTAWSDTCASILAGGTINTNNVGTKEVVVGWHQALDNLASQLSRQLDASVSVDISRAEAGDPALRIKNCLGKLSSEGNLSGNLLIPDAAGPINVCADLKKRSLTIAMRLKAPGDRKTIKARLSWLLRQLAKSEAANIYVRLLWPGRSAPTLFKFEELRTNPDLAAVGKEGSSLLSMEILLVKDLGPRFSQRKNFIADLVTATPDFYNNIASNLTAWQAKPLKFSEDKIAPASVSTESLREDIELEALERQI